MPIRPIVRQNYHPSKLLDPDHSAKDVEQECT